MPLRSFFILILFSAKSAFAAINVVIDPGHGGTDTGAVYGSAREAEISLSVAKELKTILDSSSHFKPTLTRSKDSNLTLPERVQVAEKNQADIFLSIHTNASPDARARGVEFYFQNQLAPDEETLFLANSENQMGKANEEVAADAGSDLTKKGDVLAIVEDLKRGHKMSQSLLLSRKLYGIWSQAQGGTGTRHSNTIRQAPFYVIAKTQIPSVLIELGFISNPKESEKLMSPTFQKEIARRIYNGLLSYKEMIDKSELPRLK